MTSKTTSGASKTAPGADSSSFHNAGPYVEVFGTTGSNTLAQLLIKNSKQVKKEFDKDIKSFVVIVEGQSFHTSHIQVPKEDKNNLNLMQRYLLLQLYVMKEKSFHIELRIRDSKQQKQRLIFSTHFNHVQNHHLHTQFPLGEFFLGNIWINACFDLVDLCENVLQCKFHSLDTIIIGPTCKLRKIFTMKQNPINEVFIPQKLNFPSSVAFHPETILITSASFGEQSLRNSGEQHIDVTESEARPPKTSNIAYSKKQTHSIISATAPVPSTKIDRFSRVPKTAGPAPARSTTGTTAIRAQTSKLQSNNSSSSFMKQAVKKESIRYSQEELEELVEEETVVIFPNDLVLPNNSDYNAKNYVREEISQNRTQDDDLASVMQQSLRFSAEKNNSTENSSHISNTSILKSNGSINTALSNKDLSSRRASFTPDLSKISPSNIGSLQHSKKASDRSSNTISKQNKWKTEPESIDFEVEEHSGTLSSSYLVDPCLPKKSNTFSQDISIHGNNIVQYEHEVQEEFPVFVPQIEESADSFQVLNPYQSLSTRPRLFSVEKKNPSIQRSTPSAMKVTQHMKKYVIENNYEDDDMVNMDDQDDNTLDQLDEIYETDSPQVPPMFKQHSGQYKDGDKTSLGKLQNRYENIEQNYEESEDQVELIYDDMIGAYYDPRTNKYYEINS